MLDIYSGAGRRLANARRAAWENAAKKRPKLLADYPGAAESFLDAYAPTDWRTIARENARRRYQKNGPQWGPVFMDGGEPVRFLECVEGSGLVVVADNATERMTGRRTTGYYVDAWQDRSQHGAVLGTRGEDVGGSPRARYFAAIPDPDNDGAFRVLWRPQATFSEAAAMADSWAERDAESQREYDAAWQAGRRFAEIAEEIAEDRREALQILRDRRAASGSPALCAVIRDKVESLVESIREARAARERLAQGDGEGAAYWRYSFWPGDKRLREAFNDGAGAAVLAL